MSRHWERLGGYVNVDFKILTHAHDAHVINFGFFFRFYETLSSKLHIGIFCLYIITLYHLVDFFTFFQFGGPMYTP